MLAGCVAKDLKLTEQQKRMQRCEQYIDRQQEECLQGGHVTIDDYNDDYNAFIKAKEREKKNNTPPITIQKPQSDSQNN